MGAVALAALQPLTTYAFGPLLLPFALGTVAAAVAVVRNPAYGVAIVLAVAPFLNFELPPESLGGSLPTQPLKALVPPLSVLALAYAALLVPGGRWGRRTRAAAGGVAALLAATAIASVFALEPAESVNKLMLVVSAAAVFAAVPIACRSRDQLLVIVGGALLGLLLAAAQGLIQSSAGVFSTQGFVADFEVIGRIEGSFAHPNLYAGYLAALLPLGIAVSASPGFPGALRALGAGGALLATPALYLTFGRGALVGLIGAAVLWLALIRPRLSLAVAVAVVVAALAVAPSTLKDRFNPQTSEGDITLRSDIWTSAFGIYAQQPITGVGVNNFSIAYQELPSTAASASQRRLLHQDQLLIPPHPQSIYLQALSEQGVIGILALLAFVGVSLSVLYSASRSLAPTTSAIGLAVGVGFVSVLIHGLAEASLMSEALLPLAALLAVSAVLLESGPDLECSAEDEYSAAS
jgi:O-antigen ligase